MAATDTETGIFARIVDSSWTKMSREAADSILALRFAESDCDRMNQLAEKARRGSLTQSEDVELNRFIQVGNFLAVMKAKVRRLSKAFSSKGANSKR